MHPRPRGWIIPGSDMPSMLRMIDEKIRSQNIEVRHRDTLIRLREILESDLNDHRSTGSPEERPIDQGVES